MSVQGRIVPWMLTFYILMLGLTPGENASAIKIRPDVCTNAMGEQGTCMFVWECIKQEGKQLGPCVDRFLVGTCCAAPNEEANEVLGAGTSGRPFSPPKNSTDQMKPASSQVHSASVNFVSVGATSTNWMTDATNGNKSAIPGAVPSLKSSTSASTTTEGTTSTTTTSKPNRKPSLDLSECGIPTPWPKMKVVGGTAASFGDWPWQVSVRRTSFFGLGSAHRCGGAIMDKNWVVTAAHCVDDLLMSQIRARVGEFDFSTTKEPYPFQERSVSKKIVHPKYNFFNYEYDLALLKLDASLQLQPNVKPICLPPSNDTFVGRNATVTGWGRLSERGTLPSVLQEVQVPIIANEKCKEMFAKAGRQEAIPDIFMCAGYEEGGRDSCQGDSGGPLQVKGDDGRWFLAGVISWGIGCAEKNMPGVCTRVNKFTDWIRQAMT